MNRQTGIHLRGADRSSGHLSSGVAMMGRAVVWGIALVLALLSVLARAVRLIIIRVLSLSCKTVILTFLCAGLLLAVAGTLVYCLSTRAVINWV